MSSFSIFMNLIILYNIIDDNKDTKKMYFLLYIYCALREVRAEASKFPRPLEDAGLPWEALYADDSDFISTSPSFLNFLEALTPPTIGKYGLQTNASKWEHTALTPSNSDEDTP